MEIDQLIAEERNSSSCEPLESVKCVAPCNDGDDIKVVNIEDLSESTCLVNKGHKRKWRRYTDDECLTTGKFILLASSLFSSRLAYVVVSLWTNMFQCIM